MSNSVDAGRDIDRRIWALNARIDNMPKVGLSIGGGLGLLLCYFFANYDISVTALVVPSLMSQLNFSVIDLAGPVTWNLLGYGVGAYAFGWVGDRFGRQRGLVLTIIILAAGGFLTAISWDVLSFSIFRFIAGCGMGAVLALCSTYIGEVAPKDQRGRYLSKLYTLQAVLLVVVGFGSLPVLSALPEVGWRMLLAFGGLVILALFFLNKHAMVESPRWLAENGQIERAEAIVAQFETRIRHTYNGEVEPPEEPTPATGAVEVAQVGPMATLIRAPFLRRLITILLFWFIYYIAAYGFLSYTTLLLEGVGVAQGESLFITVASRIASVVVPLLMIFLIERIERRTLITIGAAIMIVGVGVLLLPLTPVSGILAVTLVNLGIGWLVVPAYIYTSELFPTRARGTASAIADGVGHFGGAVAPFVVLPVLISFGAVPALWVILGCTVVSGIMVQANPKTRNRSLLEISK
jgi:putative MFS transporter